jgi:hypothetical protein
MAQFTPAEYAVISTQIRGNPNRYVCNATHYISSFTDFIVANLYAAEVNLISHILIAVVDVRGQSKQFSHVTDFI